MNMISVFFWIEKRVFFIANLRWIEYLWRVSRDIFIKNFTSNMKNRTIFFFFLFFEHFPS